MQTNNITAKSFTIDLFKIYKILAIRRAIRCLCMGHRHKFKAIHPQNYNRPPAARKQHQYHRQATRAHITLYNDVGFCDRYISFT